MGCFNVCWVFLRWQSFGLPHPTYPFSVGMRFECLHHLLCARCITKVLFEFGC
jgi:hypothetical protein